MRTLALTTRLVAILAAVLALSAPTAAAGQATNGRTLTLRFPPEPGDAACTSRTIELAHGSYTWQLGETSGLFSDWGLPLERPGVAWRDHTWTDCIRFAVRDGWAVYRHDAYLTWPGDSFAAEPHYVMRRSPGRYSYWFGSTLRRN